MVVHKSIDVHARANGSRRSELVGAERVSKRWRQFGGSARSIGREGAQSFRVESTAVVGALGAVETTVPILARPPFPTRKRCVSRAGRLSTTACAYAGRLVHFPDQSEGLCPIRNTPEYPPHVTEDTSGQRLGQTVIQTTCNGAFRLPPGGYVCETRPHTIHV